MQVGIQTALQQAKSIKEQQKALGLVCTVLTLGDGVPEFEGDVGLQVTLQHL